MKIPNTLTCDCANIISLARIVSEDSQQMRYVKLLILKSSKDS